MGTKRRTAYTQTDPENNVWRCEHCEMLWQFEADGPYENLWEYCPYCGRKIQYDQGVDEDAT